MQRSACDSRSLGQRLRAAKAFCPSDTALWLLRQSGKSHRRLDSRHRHDNRRESTQARSRYSTDLLQTIRQSLRIWRCLSFLRLLQDQAYRSDLIMFCVVPKFTGNCDEFLDIRVDKVSMTSFAAASETSRLYYLVGRSTVSRQNRETP